MVSVTEYDYLAITRAIFDALDKRDTEAFLGYMTEDVVAVAANAKPVVGKAAFEKLYTRYRDKIKSSHHEFENLWLAANDDSVVIAALRVHYTRMDDSTISLPCINVLRMEGPLCSRYMVYVDIGPALRSSSYR